MSQKLLLVVVVAILAALAQGRNAAQTKPGSVAELLHKLEADVKKSEAPFHNYEKAIDATSKKTESLIQTDEKKLKTELSELKKKADTAGVKIDDCLKGTEENVKKLYVKINQEIKHCYSDKSSKEINNLKDFETEFKKIDATITTIKKDLSKCEKEKENAQCLKELTARISKENVLLVALQKKVSKVAPIIAELEKKYNTCSTTETTKFSSELKKIETPVVTCINKKLHK